MKSKAYLLGIDIGTGGAKAGLFDLDGNLISLHQLDYHFTHPKPGWSEISPLEVWEKVTQVVRGCVSRSGQDPREIAALGLSVLGETGLAVDEQGSPVYAAIESMDQRENAYKPYVEWFEKNIGAAEIFRRTSYPLNHLPPPHKILWLRDHEPQVFDRAAKYVTFQDFVVWRMTGRPVMDYSMASRTMLFDIQKKTWIGEYLSAMGISTDFLSPVQVASQVAGELGEEAAEELGLPAGILVVPGAHDQSCAALGVGVVREGVAGDGTGSVEAISTASRKPIQSEDMRARGIGSQCHVTSDLYLPLGFQLSAGSLVRWYRDQLSAWEQEEARRLGSDAYDLITGAASSSPPGANGLLVLPHWSGAGTGRIPALNPASRGSILGLTLAHTRADLSRAIFEGITLETRFIIESLESSGITIQELVVTGGGAKSPFWLQLKADITGKRIVVPEVTEASLLGAALLGGVGAGIYLDIEEAAGRACRARSFYEPGPDQYAAYGPVYAVYKDLYEALIGISSRLVQLAA
jgi:xylulokinase